MHKIFMFGLIHSFCYLLWDMVSENFEAYIFYSGHDQQGAIDDFSNMISIFPLHTQFLNISPLKIQYHNFPRLLGNFPHFWQAPAFSIYDRDH
jgi:hypothetical protein